VYASMYGNTERMADAISRALTKEGIHSVKVHNVSRSHVSYIIGDVWRARAVIVGSPTYNMQLFPLIESCLSLLQNKGIKNRITGIFGSYGWAGGGMQQLREFAAKMSWDVVKPEVTVKGAPTDETLNQCSLLGMNITRRLLGESE
ncbi:MAG: flavodoxin domain-containing protein, partial [bacterium]